MDFSLKIVWVRAIWKSGSKLQDNKEKNENGGQNKTNAIAKLQKFCFWVWGCWSDSKIEYLGGFIS